jgi:glyoxylate/hydroxypyruvate reductase A
MALLFYSVPDDPAAWRHELLKRIPDLDFRVWPDQGDPGEIDSALVWRPPPGMLAALPNLRAVFSLAAGVDAMLADTTLPPVPLCRLVDPQLTGSMSEFVLLLVLRYHRRLERFAAQQRRALWHLEMARPAGTTRVGVMGLGVLGADAASLLVRHGFAVSGWSRSARSLPGVTCHAGAAGLGPFLAEADILVCLLPLTPETEGILSRDLFARLPRGARLINVARGRHLIGADLIEALDTGQLGHASLDVFDPEPLPPEHPFWRHPRIDVTPHVASNILAETGADGVAENILRLRRAAPLLNVVDRSRGY